MIRIAFKAQLSSKYLTDIYWHYHKQRTLKRTQGRGVQNGEHLERVNKVVRDNEIKRRKKYIKCVNTESARNEGEKHCTKREC